MILAHDKYQMGLSEREMSLVMDALDMAAGNEVDTKFNPNDFAEVLDLFEQRFAW